jgi:hypothetical protein
VIVELLTCELCGGADLNVAIGLAWYRDSLPSEQVQSISRCKDAAACRSRVEIRGESWPLLDRNEGAA